MYSAQLNFSHIWKENKTIKFYIIQRVTSNFCTYKVKQIENKLIFLVILFSIFMILITFF